VYLAGHGGDLLDAQRACPNTRNLQLTAAEGVPHAISPGVSSLASAATGMEGKGREGEVHFGTWEWPMAWHSTSASRVPARPPDRELMNTSSGLSGSAEPRNCLVPRRYSCGILRIAG
jgi:hypothetical protein